MAAQQTLGRKLAEKFFYDFSLYNTYFHKHMDYTKCVALRHNMLLTGGFWALITFSWPFRPSFPTMGTCPSGWEGTWVCEKDEHKAWEMYKAWKEGKK